MIAIGVGYALGLNLKFTMKGDDKNIIGLPGTRYDQRKN